jgi:lipid A 3-O-deacylase
MLLLQTLPKRHQVIARAALFLVLVSTATPAWPGDPAPAVFVQAGMAEHSRSITIGGVWSLPWQYERPCCLFTSSIEATVGRWNTSADSDEGVMQFGLTPAVRVERSSPDSRWFLEAGIGANIITPIYRYRNKRFSTAFNFGDHLAIGRSFGMRRDHELTVRIQHFSNGGIKSPNPGENFVQIRYQKLF